MIICGLDECGRGALAGPLVAAGVVLNQPFAILFSDLPFPLKDSKGLTPAKRQVINDYLKTKDITIVIEEISVAEINSRGIGWANRTVFDRIIKKLTADHYIVDGNLSLESAKTHSVESLVKADTKIVEATLASIVAKVYRDNLMTSLHLNFPNFQWDKNKGYGSPEHIEALCLYGPCPHHRDLFVSTAISNYQARFNLTK